MVEDEFLGDGEHEFETYFHFDDGLQFDVRGTEIEARDEKQKVGLIVRPLSLEQPPAVVNQHVSRDYGELRDSFSACWRVSGRVNKLSWKIFPTK